MKTLAHSIVLAGALVSAAALSPDVQAAGGGHAGSARGHGSVSSGHGSVSSGHGFGRSSGGHGGYRHGWGSVRLGVAAVGALGYYGAYGPYAAYGPYGPYYDYYYDGYYVGPAPAVVTPDYPAPTGTAPVPQARRTPDPIFYPRNGQGAAATEADLRECNRWAATQREAMNDASIFQRATFACMEGRGYTVR